MEITCKMSFSALLFTVNSLYSCECIYVLIMCTVSFISFLLKKMQEFLLRLHSRSSMVQHSRRLEYSGIYVSSKITHAYIFIYQVVQKVRFPMFYLNIVTAYRATHEVDIHSHISFILYLVTKSVQILIPVICQFVKSFTDKKWALGM